MGNLTLRVRELVSTRAFALVSLLAFAALLFALRSQRLADNSVPYCLDAKRGTNLFHPHHVIFTAAIHWIHSVLAWIGVTVDTITVAQAHNACFASALIGALMLWLGSARDARRFGAVELAAPLLCAGFSVFLEFATQPQSYVPAVACAVGALAALANGSGRVRLGRATLAAALLCLAVLYHQISVLFTILPLAQALASEGARRRPAVREACLAIALAGGLTLGAYLAAFVASATGESFVDYCTFFLHMGQPWGTAQNVGAVGLEALGNSLALGTVGTASAFVGQVALIVVVLLLAANVLAAARGASSPERRITCVAWAALLLGFLLWWEPSQANYYVFALPPMAVLAVLSLRDACGETTARPIAVTLAVAVLAGGFVRQVIPNHVTSNPLRERAAALRAIGDESDVRICGLKTAFFLWYDFDDPSVIPLPLAMAGAVKGSPLGAKRSRPRDPLLGVEGIAIPLIDLRPDDKTELLARASPDDPSRPWLDFAEWLFDLRDPGAEGTRRAFDVRRMPNDELAVVLSNRREPCRDMDELLQSLDRELARLSGKDVEFEFVAWKRDSAR